MSSTNFKSYFTETNVHLWEYYIAMEGSSMNYCEVGVNRREECVGYEVSCSRFAGTNLI